jgi:hypothetical protein
MKIYTAAAVMAISAPFLPAVLAQSRRKRVNRHLESKASKSPVGNGKTSKVGTPLGDGDNGTDILKLLFGSSNNSYYQSYHNDGGVMIITTNNYNNCPDENKRFRQRRLQEGQDEGEDYVQSYHNEGISITNINTYYCDEGGNSQSGPTLDEALAIYEAYKGEDQGFSLSYDYEGGDVGYDGAEGYEGYEGGNEGIRRLRNKSYHNKYKHQRNLREKSTDKAIKNEVEKAAESS